MPLFTALLQHAPTNYDQPQQTRNFVTRLCPVPTESSHRIDLPSTELNALAADLSTRANPTNTSVVCI